MTLQTRAERRRQESFYFDMRFNKVELDMEQGGGGGKEGNNVSPLITGAGLVTG